jgi:hypothetical protein
MFSCDQHDGMLVSNTAGFFYGRKIDCGIPCIAFGAGQCEHD